MRADEPALSIRSLCKSFRLHLRGGLRIAVLDDLSLDVYPSECVVLAGPSGIGKSTLIRCVYGNYRADRGRIEIQHRNRPVEIVAAEPRQLQDIRRHTIGHVSQFLRTIPRVACRDVVAETLIARGMDRDPARHRAATILERLGIAARLFDLPPATFSGGEQQRVNIARTLVARHSILLLDEPTASLDDANRAVVAELVCEARRDGTAILAIAHDPDTRANIATRFIELPAQAKEPVA